MNKMAARVPASRDTLFMRGFNYRQDIDQIRSFFGERCGKSTVEFFREDGKEQLFLALKFETKEIAKDVLQRFNETDILGDKIYMTWYRDLRRARPFNDYRQKFGGGGGGGREGYFQRRPMPRYDRGRRYSRSRSRSRSRSGSSGSRSGGSSDRSHEGRKRHYGDASFNKMKHSNRRYRRSLDKHNYGDYSDDSSRERNASKRPKQLFQSKVVAVSNAMGGGGGGGGGKADSTDVNTSLEERAGSKNNHPSSPAATAEGLISKISNNNKWGDTPDKKILPEPSGKIPDAPLEKRTSQWTPINEAPSAQPPLPTPAATITTTTTRGNNNNVENANNNNEDDDVLLGLRKDQLKKHLKEVLLKEALLKEQQLYQQRQQEKSTPITQQQQRQQERSTPTQQQQQQHSKQPATAAAAAADDKQQKQPSIAAAVEDYDGFDVSGVGIKNITAKYLQQVKQFGSQQQQQQHQQQKLQHQQLADQVTIFNNTTNNNSSKQTMKKRKKKPMKEKYHPFGINDEVESGEEEEEEDEEEGVYYERKLKMAAKKPRGKVKQTLREIGGMEGERVGGKSARVLTEERLEMLKLKKEEVEKTYKQDCETFSVVTKLLISKDPELEDRLQKSLRENLRDIGHRSIQELKDFVDRLKKDDSAYRREEDEGEEEEEEDDDDGIPLDKLF